MTKEDTCLVDNPRLRDGSNKLIFGDNILCAQFLRDYADMEILRKVQPEDIEDVSERYVPLYSTERESDTVKRVNVGKYLPALKNENPLELPLYIVSLVEHKTKVEYNVAMQILRYMIHIWEDYEKEMNRRYPHISARKDFRYPPVFPIVYYEGTEKWTAPEDLLSVMEKVLRALLYSMNLEEDKAENAVAKIKERKMGRLFEGVTFDFQAAVREAAEEAAKEATEKATKEATEKATKEATEKAARRNWKFQDAL